MELINQANILKVDSNSPHIAISPQSLGSTLKEVYELTEPIQCDFLQRGINDHYRVSSSEGDFVARVYHQPGPWVWKKSYEDILFELQLLQFLHNHTKIKVAPPIPRKDGKLLGTIHLLPPPGQSSDQPIFRHFMLMPLIPGKTRSPQSRNEFILAGTVLAELHQAIENFHSNLNRFEINLDFIAREGLNQANRLLPLDLKSDIPTINAIFDQILTRLESSGISTSGPNATGIIHGDFHYNNLLFQPEEQITLLDFDFCGNGWRLFDIVSFQFTARGNGAPNELLVAFQEAYEKKRPLFYEERESIPLFWVLHWIWEILIKIPYAELCGHYKYVRAEWKMFLNGLLYAAKKAGLQVPRTIRKKKN